MRCEKTKHVQYTRFNSRSIVSISGLPGRIEHSNRSTPQRSVEDYERMEIIQHEFCRCIGFQWLTECEYYDIRTIWYSAMLAIIRLTRVL